MTHFEIPAAVVEAAARADYEHWRDMNNVRGDTLDWEDIEPEVQDEHRLGVTAALLAGLEAWPGMESRPTFGPSRIILPLKENTDED